MSHFSLDGLLEPGGFDSKAKEEEEILDRILVIKIFKKLTEKNGNYPPNLKNQYNSRVSNSKLNLKFKLPHQNASLNPKCIKEFSSEFNLFLDLFPHENLNRMFFSKLIDGKII